MPDDSPTYITTGAAAKLLGYTDIRSIHRLLNTGEISGFRTPGGHWRVDRASIIAMRDRASVIAEAS